MNAGSRAVRVCHVITGLERGGAELMLERLIGATRQQMDAQVLSLTGVGAVGASLRAAGVPVTALGMNPLLPAPWKIVGLLRVLRRLQPDLVQTWLYHADLLGGLVARMAGLPVIWNVRQSNLDPAVNKPRTLLVARLCAWLSTRMPAAVVFCSGAAQRTHRELGYAAQRERVIHNGFDARTFHPDPEARRSVRAELGVPADATLVGLVGRYDPQKDHAGFLRACSMLPDPATQFVLAGQGVDAANPRLRTALAELPMAGGIHLLGPRDDMPRIQAALDVAVSSSLGEGLPNAIGEAMACGVPCVVTDVGDSADLVGDTGRVVSAGDPAALASAIQELLSLSADERAALGERARSRIEKKYALAASAAEYLNLYRSTCAA